MIDLDNFHFIRPLCLGLVPIVMMIWWLRQKQSDPMRQWRNVMEPELLEAMTIHRDDGPGWRQMALLAAWTLTAIALAGPTWRPEPSPFADDPIPVMLLVKSDQSMGQSDLTPNRMERARLKAIDFANLRKGQPLGLIAYAGSPHLVLPPTRDTEVVATMAAELGPEIMPKPGDDLASALRLAADTLDKTGGSIVVVADTVTPQNQSRLAGLRSQNRGSIEILGIARNDTPEAEDLVAAASALNANLTIMTADDEDVQSLVRRVADTPIAISSEDGGTRWAEAGWWLTPIIATIVLAQFRREESKQELAT